MLDVHAPHEAVHGWRDFLLHLFTITIGLLIALSLEGCVEWQHHRHLVHEAEAGLHVEIKGNADRLKGIQDDIHKQQANLRHDVEVLKSVIATHALPKHGEMEIAFHISGFEDVSWKTAQTTGALSYMAYPEAQKYADIYDLQSEVYVAEKQAARDAILSLGPFVTSTGKDEVPSTEDAKSVIDHIGVLQGQLLLVDSLVTGLDGEYRRFLTAQP